MDLSAYRAAVELWLKGHERPTWKPVAVPGDGPPEASKFSGAAWLPDGEAWPACRTCGRPLQLFLQLNLGQLPPELDGRFGTGLLQFFACREGNCDHYEPFEGSKLLRIVQPAGGAPPDLPEDPGRYPPPADHVVGKALRLPEVGRTGGTARGLRRPAVGPGKSKRPGMRDGRPRLRLGRLLTEAASRSTSTAARRPRGRSRTAPEPPIF